MKYVLKLFFMKNYSLSYYFSKLKQDRKTKLITIVMVFLIPSIVSLVVVYSDILVTMYDVFVSINQPSFYLVLIYMLLFMAMLVFGLMHAITALCFSDDVEMLLHLPIKKHVVLSAKFMEILLVEYLFALFVYTPGIIVFGIQADMGVMYYLFAVIGFFLVPILPLVIASMFAILINRFVNISTHQELFRTIITLFMLLLFLGLQVLLFKSVNMMDVALIENLVNDNMYLLDVVSTYNFFIPLFVNGLFYENVWYVVLLIASTVTVFMLFIALFHAIYIKSLLYRKSAHVGKEIDIENMKRSGTIRQLFFKDIRILFRTSAYFINILSIPIIIPIIFGVFIVSGMYDSLFEILENVSYEGIMKYFSVGYFVMVVFMVSATPVTSTSLSREGKSIWISQTIPVEPREQIMGRMMIAVLILIIFILTTLLPIAILIGVLSIDILWIGLGAFFIAIPVMLTGLMVDVYKPMTTWKNPTVAVKQNLNVLLNMLFAGIHIGLIFLIYSILSYQPIALFVNVIVALLLSFLVYKLLESMFLSRLSQIK